MMLPRPFWILFAIQFMGALCDNIYRNALLIFVTFVMATGAAHAVPVVSLAAALFILPFFLFSAFAGSWADRSDQARAIRLLKAIEIPLVIGAALALASQSIGAMLAALFLLGTQAAFFGPLKYSILPRLLPPAQLTAGNGYVEAATFIAILLGTIIGGVLIVLPHGVIWVGLILGVFSVLAYILSCFLPSILPQTAPIETASPWRTVQKNAVLRASILGVAWLWFVGSVFLTLLPDFVRTVLQNTPTVATFLMAMFSVGVAAGSIAAGLLRRSVDAYWVVIFGLVGLCLASCTVFLVVTYLPVPVGAAGMIAFLTHPGGVMLSVVMFMLAGSAGLFSVPLYTALQTQSPSHMRARIIAVNNIVNAGFMVSSALLIIGAHAVGLSTPQIFVATGLLGLSVLLYLWRWFKP